MLLTKYIKNNALTLKSPELVPRRPRNRGFRPRSPRAVHMEPPTLLPRRKVDLAVVALATSGYVPHRAWCSHQMSARKCAAPSCNLGRRSHTCSPRRRKSEASSSRRSQSRDEHQRARPPVASTR